MSIFDTERITIPTRSIPESLALALPPPQINIVRRRQRQAAWCYAACAKMAIEHCRPEINVAQCDVAGFVKDTDCCATPIKSKCVTSGCRKDQIKPIFTHWNVSSQRLNSSISFSRVALEINATPRRLIEAVIDWNGTPGQQSSHAVLIAGNTVALGDEWVFVVDPLDPPKYYDWFKHSFVEDGFGNGTWDSTWLKLRKV